MECLSVLPEYQEPIQNRYPAHHVGDMIEDFAIKYFRECKDLEGIVYIPINWTGWYCNHEYKNGNTAIRDYVRTLKLEKGKKYFTVAQNDDGTMCDDILKSMCDCTIFGAGGVGDIPIPLLCSSHNAKQKENPKYLASFIGTKQTHPIRAKMINALQDKEDVFVGQGNTKLFVDIMTDSKFALCPRGYGETSFRMYEAIDCGVVPVCISDRQWIPLDFCNGIEAFAVIVDSSEVTEIYNKLKAITEDQYVKMKTALTENKSLFTMENVCKYIHYKMGKKNECSDKI